MISTVWNIVSGSWLWKALTGFLTGFALLLGVYHSGKRKARSEARTEALRDYVKTKERIDEVQPTDDRDANLRRLRKRGLVRKSDL